MRRFQQKIPLQHKEALVNTPPRSWLITVVYFIMFVASLFTLWYETVNVIAHEQSTEIVNGVFGDNGCYPFGAQKHNKFMVPGDYDIFILSRHVLNGVCAMNSENTICAEQQSQLSKQIVTKIKGFWPARKTCLNHKPIGYYWPQYCSNGQNIHFNQTSFGSVVISNPTSKLECTNNFLKSNEFCNIFETLKQLWPNLYHENNENPYHWISNWNRHGSCSGYHPDEYFQKAILSDKLVLKTDHFPTQTLGPSWPVNKYDGIFDKSYTIKQLFDIFGGAYRAGFHCQKNSKTDRLYLTSVTQCLRKNELGDELIPTTCPRWIIHQMDSCKPPGTIGGAKVWLQEPRTEF